MFLSDSITFKIDDENRQELIPTDGTLCEAIGFSSDQCAMWGSTSKIAPFNNEVSTMDHQTYVISL